MARPILAVLTPAVFDHGPHNDPEVEVLDLAAMAG